MANKMKLVDFADTYLESNSYSPYVSGYIKEGKNGLYDEPETEIRNLCHWAIIEKYSKQQSCKLKQKLLAYTSKGPPFNFRNSQKNSSNGLIGTAWFLESLYHCFEFNDYKINISNFNSNLKYYLQSIDFSYKTSVWQKVFEPNGTIGPIDRTYNHQLWLAANLYRYSIKFEFDYGLVQSLNFLENNSKNMSLKNNGVIYHTLKTYPHYHRTKIKRLINRNYSENMAIKEVGYHYFSVMQLSMLNHEFSNHNMFELLDKIQNENFQLLLNENIYGSTYNPVEIEYFVSASYILPPNKLEQALSVLNQYFHNFFDANQFMLTGSNDLANQNARMYELFLCNPVVQDLLRYNRQKNSWELVFV